MRVAIATEGDMVSPHFGRCDGYTIYEIGCSGPVRTGFHESPEHQPGMMPGWLRDKGADVVIAGGAGPMAQELFGKMGIKLILGVSGALDEVIGNFASGSLPGGESLCDSSGSCSH